MNILAIDQGTSATKALLVGPGNEVLGSAEVPVATHPVDGDGVEADPEELWRSVEAAGRRALDQAGAPAHAVALANQGETVLAWDPATGRPLSQAIVWQDRRRLDLRPARPGPRGRAPGDHRPAARPVFRRAEDDLAARATSPARGSSPPPTAGCWQRLRGRVRDRRRDRVAHDAAGPRRGHWSATACDAFGIAPETLPAVADCDAVVGETTAFGGARCRSAGLAVDQQAALFGQGCLATGEAKCTYGTGAFLLVTTGARRRGRPPGCRHRSRGGCRGDDRLLPRRPGLHGGLGDELADPAGRAERRRPTWIRSAAASPTPAAWYSSRRWPAWARRTGRPAPAAPRRPPAVDRARPRGPGGRRGNRRVRSRCSPGRSRPTWGRRSPRCGSTAA